jgi:hypothetical protein
MEPHAARPHPRGPPSPPPPARLVYQLHRQRADREPAALGLALSGGVAGELGAEHDGAALDSGGWDPDVLAMAVRGTTLAWISVGQPPQATTIGSGLVTQLGRRLANDRHPGSAIDTTAVYVTSVFGAPGSSPVISRLARSATCAP